MTLAIYRVPSNISMLFAHCEQVHHHFTRFSAAGNLYVKASRTNQLLFSFARIGVRVWNSIPMKLRIKNRTPFTRELKNRLLKLIEIEKMNVDLRWTEICKYLSSKSNFLINPNLHSSLSILNCNCNCAS